jgi:hypothetical protein
MLFCVREGAPFSAASAFRDFDPPLIRTPKFGQSLIEIRECEIKIITQIAELEIKFSDR